MNLLKYRPRAPYWPLGSVGRFYIKKSPARGDDAGLMAVERLPIRNVRRIDNGWVILAGDKGEYIFEVDANGESPECVPWDDEMEREFQLYGEDIPPTYNMPEPRPEPEAVDPQRAQVVEPIGIITQTDPGLYPTGYQDPYVAAANRAREFLARDAENARRREAEAEAAEAYAEEQRARQEVGHRER